MNSSAFPGKEDHNLRECELRKTSGAREFGAGRGGRPAGALLSPRGHSQLLHSVPGATQLEAVHHFPLAHPHHGRHFWNAARVDWPRVVRCEFF